jgi:hypothetical protein
MPKRKAGAKIQVADGAGGMRGVEDLRFETGEWPIEFLVPPEDAVAWMAHLRAERDGRGWSSSGLAQADAAENSGTLSLHAGTGPSPPTLHVVWERPRGTALRVRARPGGTPSLSLDRARDFMDAVNERTRAGVVDRAHRRDLLTYEGLPWRGELWLGDDTRLGPPSRFPDALVAPQVVIVDGMAEGIGPEGITATFQAIRRELQIFLGITLGIRTTPVRPQHGWVGEFDEQGHPIACTLRSVGYWEVGQPQTFPVRGSAPPIPREVTVRPGLGRTGIWPYMRELWVPDDIEELWGAFRALPAAKREQLLRAGNAYLLAGSMWPDQRTAYATFLVVACEALKPPGKRYDRLNLYDVVAGLIGVEDAARLRKLAVPPQQVRSRLVHRGTLAADEFLSMLVYDDFVDPSFDEMLRELSQASRICLIEWLRRGGEYKIPKRPALKHGRRSRDS